ncbi:hypothetical protein VPH35_111949 [Triticum aestivum]
MSVSLLATALCNRLCIRVYIPQTSSMKVTIPSFAPASLILLSHVISTPMPRASTKNSDEFVSPDTLEQPSPRFFFSSTPSSSTTIYPSIINQLNWQFLLNLRFLFIADAKSKKATMRRKHKILRIYNFLHLP